MHMPQFFLLIHLVGAALTGVAIFITAVILAKNAKRHYRQSAIGIAIIAAIQVMSGAALSLAAAQAGGHVVPVLTYCKNLGLYVAILASVAFVLYRRMQQSTTPFPLRFAVASASLSFLVAALVGTSLYL